MKFNCARIVEALTGILIYSILVIPVVAEELKTGPVEAADTTLSPAETELINWIDSREASILEELTRHVEINTGTENIAGLDTYRELLRENLIELGFETEERSSEPVPILGCNGGAHHIANHLVATRSGTSKNRILLNGHMDTVFPIDDEFQKLIVGNDGSLKGPGVADMKGGVVIMLNALRALDASGLLTETTMTVLLNSDEEIGSLGSRALIEELAVQHDVGLVFEGSYNNLATRARKGLGQARIKVTGRESHAGSSHQDGVSANLELAHKIIEIEKLTDYQRQTTVNAGVMGGGEKRNSTLR